MSNNFRCSPVTLTGAQGRLRCRRSIFREAGQILLL